MIDILIKAGCFVAIVVLGCVLRSVGFFKAEDQKVISKIVLNITLPASIVYSYSGKEIDLSMLSLIALGFLFSALYMVVGYIADIRKGKTQQAFAVLNLTGYSIGNFTLPFAQGFMGADGVIATSLFGIGNAFVCMGISFSAAAMIQRGDRFSLRKMFGVLVKSVPFDAYFIMAVLALLHISLPAPITEFAHIIGGANTFMAMLLLGVSFQLSGKSEAVKTVAKYLTVRYVTSAVFAIVCFFMIPMAQEFRKALVILVLSPITSSAVAFTGKLDGDTGTSGAINSLSIVISLTFIVAVLMIM